MWRQHTEDHSRAHPCSSRARLCTYMCARPTEAEVRRRRAQSETDGQRRRKNGSNLGWRSQRGATEGANVGFLASQGSAAHYEQQATRYDSHLELVVQLTGGSSSATAASTSLALTCGFIRKPGSPSIQWEPMPEMIFALNWI